MTAGIKSWGAYVPRRRLARSAIAAALAWRQQQSGTQYSGERSYGNWDEDSITMGAEAARHALADADRATIGAVQFASTTLPFADRSNAGFLGSALLLNEQIRTQDLTGSQRTGTSALLAALEAGAAYPTLLVAADRRRTRAGSGEEFAYGDGACALVVTNEDPVAVFLGGESHAADLVDHYRETTADHDYALEERWVRSEGYLKLIPSAVAALLARLELSADAIAHFVLAAPAGVARAVAKQIGIGAERVRDAELSRIGHTGTAHPLVMLGATLDAASAGETVLLVGFGQGVDVLAFRVDAAIGRSASRGGVAASINAGITDTAYVRFLAHGGALSMDAGMRAERDARTAHSVHYRKSREVNAFVGGRCTACGTVQFPKSRACVAPDCRRFDTQIDHPLAETRGRVKTYTEDWLAYTPSPPLQYGNVAFLEGGNAFIEFTDVDPGELAVGAEVRFVLRIRDVDRVRGFHRYFWKATPVRT